MTFDQFKSEIAKRTEEIHAMEAAVVQKREEFRSFVKTNLGVDPTGQIRLDSMIDVMDRVLKMKGIEK